MSIDDVYDCTYTGKHTLTTKREREREGDREREREQVKECLSMIFMTDNTTPVHTHTL